jgi:catechol 2,3-dioxygenase-like lactoylglutathione lyase family enzyme
MDSPTAGSRLTSIAPFFIVRDVAPAVAFYRDHLGFRATFTAPKNEPFFAILDRDGVRIMIKAIGPEVHPMPNPGRHPWAKWDAFVHVPDPDGLADELASRGVTLHAPLADTDDRLRGFEVEDVDGYVLFFGRPA